MDELLTFNSTLIESAQFNGLKTFDIIVSDNIESPVIFSDSLNITVQFNDVEV